MSDQFEVYADLQPGVLFINKCKISREREHDQCPELFNHLLTACSAEKASVEK